MEIVKPGFTILSELDYIKILRTIELAGRTAYKSEDKITEASAERFVRMLIERGHESVLEHSLISVKIICDRGVSHEIVRHRLVSYTQESTRYVNYNKKGMSVIEPTFWPPTNQPDKEDKYSCWLHSMEEAEANYKKLIALGAKPEEARSVLPQSTKTEIIVTANIREWRHILKLRTSKAAHPQMREIMVPLLEHLFRELPVLFDDIYANYLEEKVV